MKKSLFFLVLTTILFSMNLQAQNPPKAFAVDSLSVCDSLQWIDGVTYYDDANVFYTSNDTVHVLILSVRHSVKITAPEETRGCAFVWNGNLYTETGIYTDSLQNSYGCDSIVTLSLTISGVQRDTLDEVSACGSYTWMGRELDVSDFYSDTTEVEEYNCDSIVVLPLTITTSISFPADTVTNCGKYDYHDTTYTESGIFTRIHRNEELDCDSIYTLVLTVVPLTEIFDTIDTVRCGTFLYRFDGGASSDNYRITSDSTIQKTFENHNIEICRDSTSVVHCYVKADVEHTETINTCDHFDWNGRSYTISTIVDSTFYRGAANGCDSILHMDIRITSSPVITDIEGDLQLPGAGGDATIYASCDQENVDYIWYDLTNGNSYFGDTLSLHVNATTDILLTVTNLQTGCETEHHLVVLVGVGISDVDNTAVRIYPNPTAARIYIDCENSVREAVIYNTLGQIVTRTSMEGRNNIDVNGLTNGTYTLQLLLQNGETMNRKFVVSK